MTWLKLHRNILEWEYADEPLVLALWIHLLAKANHRPSTFKGVEVKEGQLITGRKALSVQTGLTEQQVRASLQKLSNNQQITIKTTNKYSIITIRKWKTYQASNQQKPSQLASQSTTSKEVKEIYIYPHVREGFWLEYLEHRKEVGAAMSERALKMAANKLDEWRAKGHDPTKILETAMANGWKGIFEPKEEKNGKTGYSNAKGKSQRAREAAFRGYSRGRGEESQSHSG